MNQPMRWWIDGVEGEALIPNERMLQYGDGLFETLVVRDGEIGYLERHMQRLQAGCSRLGITIPDPDGLVETLMCRAGEAQEAVLKVMLGRSGAGRGYAVPEHAGVKCIVSLYPLKQWPEVHREQGVRVRICETRLATQPVLAGIKHMNRLEQVLARREWNSGYEEGLMLDYNDRVIEGTMTNIFLVKQGGVFTPALEQCGVAGVMRSVVLDLADAMDMPVTVESIGRNELLMADEVFLCNSVIGVWPVASIESGHQMGVGPISRKLMQGLDSRQTPVPGCWRT